MELVNFAVVSIYLVDAAIIIASIFLNVYLYNLFIGVLQDILTFVEQEMIGMNSSILKTATHSASCIDCSNVENK